MRVTILNAPGYQDEWSGELIAQVRTVDGRPVSVIEYDDGSGWAVIASQYVREPHTDVDGPMTGQYDTYDYSSDPDGSPAEVAKEDRAYWDDKYADDDGEETDYDE